MPDPVVDEIKQRIDIVELISGTVQLKKAGRSFKGLCPFHQEKTPSFNVDPDRGTFHCFGCSKSGDVFTWLQETEGLDFGEALRRLADRAGVRLPERQAPRADPAVQAAKDALHGAAEWVHSLLVRGQSGAQAREYLVRRGVSGETVERFGLGWAPDGWDGLTAHLRKAGLSVEQIEAAGLAIKGERGLHDRFRARVMFPIRDADGKVTGFGGRILGDGQPKYLNSPQTATFDKSRTLYALDLARGSIRKAGQAVIVEGYMDVVLPHQQGFTNVVASLGTALTAQQIELLQRYTQTIVLALDADAAGQAATVRGLEVARQALASRRRPVPGRGATRTGYLQLSAGQIKIAVLSGGKDPDEIVREDPQAWQRMVDEAVPMMEHKLELELAGVDLNDPQRKAAAVQELVRFLVQVPDPIEWGHYIDRIAQRLRLDVRTVRNEVETAARGLRADERRQERDQQARDQQARDQQARATQVREAPAPANPETRPSSAPSPSPGAPAAAAAQAARAAPAAPTALESDPTEEHLISLLLLSPQLVRRMPTRLTPDDFWRPECRELYRAVLAQVGPEGARPAGPDGAEPAANPIGLRVDDALRDYYDRVRARGRREPYHTETQLEAAVAGVVRRIRERNLREELREAQYLLQETAGDERTALERRVERLAAQLGRVQLERSRSALYTSSPS